LDTKNVSGCASSGRGRSTENSSADLRYIDIVSAGSGSAKANTGATGEVNRSARSGNKMGTSIRVRGNSGCPYTRQS
jgi:hypothetical protein